jgi:hypothetical protein
MFYFRLATGTDHIWRVRIVTALRIATRGGLVASLLALSTWAVAAERRDEKAPVDVANAVDLFDAIESKAVDVKLIPKDATEANVMIANKTGKPLTVRLPDAFAAVPVLAQRTGGTSGGGSGNTNSNQSMGGGMGGMGGGMGMGGMGMMNIAPEKVAKFKVPTVCLEHGKKDPRPAIPYEIAKLETVTSKPGVKELLTAMGKQKLSQRAAQAAAWHLANEMSWEQLANKRIEHLNGTSEIWFAPQEIQAGMQLAHAARVLADQQPVGEETASLGKPSIVVKASQE